MAESSKEQQEVIEAEVVKEIYDKREISISASEDHFKIDNEDEIQKYEEVTHVEWIFKYGARSLRLGFCPDRKSFGTFIGTVRGVDDIAGQTTFLYRAAKKIIQEMTDRVGEDTIYTVTVLGVVGKENTMAKWGKGKGKELFEWDDEEEYYYGSAPSYRLKKIFKPTES